MENILMPQEGLLWIRIGSGFSDFVDPDPYWESGSLNRIQGQGNQEISVEKCTLFIFLKKFTTKKVPGIK
jgi:hypothetical protein